MMVLTCIDIFLRFCVTLHYQTKWSFLTPFRPITGTFEIVCLLSAIAISFALAQTSVNKGHVAVSLVVSMFPEKVQAVIETMTTTILLILFILLTWQSVVYAQHLQNLDKVTELLFIPFYPFVYVLAFGAFAVCLVVAGDLYYIAKGALRK